MMRVFCDHCGLPATVSVGASGAAVYCCHGCRIASFIVGKKGEGERSWHLLRLGGAALVSMSVMMIALVLYTDGVETSAAGFLRYVMLVLSSVSLAVSLPPFVAGAVAEFRSGRVAVDTLVAGGALAAFVVSAVNTFSGKGEVYFDTATMLPVFLALGRYIEATAKLQSLHLLQSLDELLPKYALLVVEDGSLREVPPGALQPGDQIRIRPGDRVAADGVIVEGASTFAEAHLTGEPLPRFRGLGDEVYAGGVNGAGAVVVRVTRVREDLFISLVADSVAAARLTAAPWERLAEKAATVFVPVTLAVAVLAAVGWWLAGEPLRAGTSFLSVLVVACPCALGIATPLATIQAVARAAGRGILVRGGEVLERIGAIDLIYLDKTGTVTSGRPEVAAVVVTDNEVPEEELLQWVASLEAGTGHVFARAVLAEATRRQLPLGAVRDLNVLPAGGVSATVTLDAVSRKITVSRLAEKDDAAGKGDVTGFQVSWGGTVRGSLLISDHLRDDAYTAVASLHNLGIATVLLSGDSFAAAQAAATRAGIPTVKAPGTPAEKEAIVRAAVAAGRKVAMVGDGINDAPALAAAGVGIALGGGADLARLAGDVVLVSDTLADIPWLVALSRCTRRIITENLVWAFLYNAVAITAAAAGVLHPLLAAVAMVASSLTVILNSFRIRKFSGSHFYDAALKSPSNT